MTFTQQSEDNKAPLSLLLVQEFHIAGSHELQAIRILNSQPNVCETTICHIVGYMEIQT